MPQNIMECYWYKNHLYKKLERINLINELFLTLNPHTMFSVVE